MVLIDTSVFSLLLRRRADSLSLAEKRLRIETELLLNEGRIRLLGLIRQELLSGIRDEGQFLKLRDYLRLFPDVEVAAVNHEDAARMGNKCRSAGIAGDPIDFLLCSVSVKQGWPIFTADLDFGRYQTCIPVKLHSAR
jgi:predicted nucleic acid-binding protein